MAKGFEAEVGVRTRILQGTRGVRVGQDFRRCFRPLTGVPVVARTPLFKSLRNLTSCDTLHIKRLSKASPTLKEKKLRSLASSMLHLLHSVHLRVCTLPRA